MNNRIQPKQLALALSIALIAGTASADVGYLSTSRDTVVRSGTGLCWHTSAWSPERAIAECDAVPRVQVPAPLPVVAAPPPAPEVKPAPAPQPAPIAKAAEPVPTAPVMRRLTLDTELLFGFDSSKLRPAGQEKLRELAKEIKGAEVEHLSAVGYADRIGAPGYNRELSEKRAAAVRDYLGELGLETKRMDIAGKGEADPVTKDACKNLRGKKLISCLQPDRRVEIEVRGQQRSAAR